MFVSLLIMVVPTALLVVAILLVRHHLAPTGGFLDRMPAAGDIFGAAGTGLAVVLGFVIFLSFGSYQTAREDSGMEAVAVQQQYDVAGFFDPSVRDALQAETICYGRAVIDQEWPAMAAGRTSSAVQLWVDRMNTSVQQVPVHNQRDQAALSHWFDESAARQDGRRGRLAEASALVPGYLWAVLVLLVLAVLGFLLLFADPEAGGLGQGVMMGSIALTVFASLALIWTLDRPFNDRGAAISSSRMRVTVLAMSGEFGSGLDGLPCDAHGTPH
ncbi:MAG: hypothetical protein QOH37_2879 [Nocardioidaceae bacterium]|jgi:hypothetical protein|nr:hypothetical protein [Nocardioidaceae bacterium]